MTRPELAPIPDPRAWTRLSWTVKQRRAAYVRRMVLQAQAEHRAFVAQREAAMEPVVVLAIDAAKRRDQARKAAGRTRTAAQVERRREQWRTSKARLRARGAA